jgi:hypothetical protein
VYTVFALYAFFHTLSSLPLPPTDIKLTGRTCCSLLFSDFVKEREKNDILIFLMIAVSQGVY